MKLPSDVKPPYRRMDKEVLTAAFWADMREGAFSLAGVTALGTQDPQARVEKECLDMTAQSKAQGADDEFCKILSLIYTGFFWEGIAAVKAGPLPSLGKKT